MKRAQQPQPRPAFIYIAIGAIVLTLAFAIYTTLRSGDKAAESGRAAQESLERAFH